MSMEEVQQKLKCRRCGRPNVVTTIKKPTPELIKVYMNCPDHLSETAFKIPVSLYPEASDQIREHVLLCRKCGQPVEVVGQRAGKRITKIEVRCPIHGMGIRKINNTLLDAILTPSPTDTARGVPEPTPSPTETAKEVPEPTSVPPTKFCPSCGTQVPSPEALFCHYCGASLE